jgi:hypothetical protein
LCNLFRKNSESIFKKAKNIGGNMTELLTDPKHTRGDLQMIRQAIRHDWDIPEQLMSVLPKIAGAMAVSSKESPSTRLKAIETILKMKAQNDSAEELSKPKEHRHTHSIELGPVTVENLAEHKRRLLEELGT